MFPYFARALILDTRVVRHWIPGAIFNSLLNLLKIQVSEARVGPIRVRGHGLNPICGGGFFFPPDISEIGRSAKSYCEHTARTQPTLSDIVVTLVEMGE